MDWLNVLEENISWIFSGIGVFVLGIFIKCKKNKNRITQTQKSGKNSTNIQLGEININSKEKE